MPSIQQLREQRLNVWSQMTEVIEAAEREGRDLSAEESEKYDRAEADLDRLDREVTRLERHAEREKSMRTVNVDPVVNPTDERSAEDLGTEYRNAFVAYVTRGMAELDNEQRAILRAGWQSETRAQAVGTNSAGGYLVPEGFRAQITETMKDYGAVQEVAQVIVTTTGASLPWPTNDDTANVGALLAENTQATEQDLTFGTKTLGAYKYTSKIVRVSLEFLQDVDWVDSEDFLNRKFAERLGRIHNQHWTTGTGTAQPQGIVTGATSGVTAASTTAITADELIDLVHSVDPAYRRSPRAMFMFNDARLKEIRKLKASGTGEYLFQPAAAAGQPDTIHGYPYVINQDMAAAAAGVKSALFGDFFAGYVVRIVREMQMIRLNERYADYGQVGFIAFDRADGLVQDASAYKALTQAAA